MEHAIYELRNHSIADFLFPAPAPPTIGGIFKWWEKRRLAYNGIVGAVGLFSWITTTLMAMVVHEHPIGFGPPIVFGLMANLWYFSGPIVEIALRLVFGIRLLPPGPALFRAGLTFSVGLALLPTMAYSIMMMAKVVIAIVH